MTNVSKTCCGRFLPEFVRLFFPHIAAQLDCSHPHFLDKELFTQPREGVRKLLDLVVEVQRRDTGEPGLIHLEIQAYRAGLSGRRMYDCNTTLRHRHGQVVWSIVLYLREGGGTLSPRSYVERFVGEEVVRFRYWLVNLSRLEVREYEGVGNPLAGGLMALMRRGELGKVEHKLRCYERIMEWKRDETRREMLVDIVDTYLPLRGEEAAEFERRVRGREEEEMGKVVTQRELRGRPQGQQQALLRLMQRKFGELPREVEQRVRGLEDEEQLGVLLDRILFAESLRDMGLEEE
ncbi:MAG TPA: DUF4351 domain-containing protein [Armatimonadetes bacterium]|nr:DUF4351 domain-containing protein [Armatimonadota bacterium]